ncbi:MAG TPA: DPP IV N-terminal domain-containing protein [Bacteroidia bacterium]|jgi:dipeptidyl-peptidase-4|nr:DPP IV N-terminal domain-containing protein [Bacteroidia bacterium]
MKKTITFFILFFYLHLAFAQTKLLTIEDALTKNKTTLAPAKLKQLQWIKGSDLFSYVQKKGEAESLIIQEATQKIPQQEISIALLNEALKTINEASLSSYPAIQWKNKNQFNIDIQNKTLLYDISKKQITVERTTDINELAEGKDVAPKTNYMAYTVKNNLFVYDGKNELIVTNDADENIVNGMAVHREEFGIMKGTFWSPTGNLLAFYKMDQRMVTDYPIIDWTVRPAKSNIIKYPMAGDKSHEVTVGIYNVQTGKTVFLQTGEPKEQYLTNIAWSPDEQHIYIAVLNRKQNHLKFNSYSAVTGYFEKTLFEEKNDKYVHPMNPMVFVPNHPDQFIWQSERDGYNHLYLYNLKGECKQLTKGKWVVTSVSGFDAKGTKVFYSSTAEGAITRNLYSVDFKKAKITRITTGEGTHAPWYSEKDKSISWLSEDGKYALDNFQSTNVPREIAVYSTQGKKVNTLLTAENPLKDYQLGSMNIFKLKSESGEDLFCRMYKPTNFDSTKKYPVIVWQYNGPNVQLINNSWNGAAADLWFQYMAERGFILFTLDGRGSANRGLAFEQAIFRQVGTGEMKDQLVGVNYLKKLKFVDTLRMGLYGWSYGGFMTVSMMTRYPGIFKVAVAGGPVIDWSYYEVMYTERYMDTPEENPQGYKEAALIPYIDRLKGKLMIIHGTQDNVVVWQHSLMYIKACVDKGKQIDYFVYPGHEHNVLGKDREHLFQKITDYFIQNL